MELLKKGSRGDSVKILQSKLGINADGVFGDKTEEAVKAFQKNNGLAPDGIVGDKTWAKLGFTTNQNKCIDPSVVYKPLPVHVSKLTGRDIKYLAIHFTGSSNSRAGRAINTYNTFMKRQASADFCVDDATIVQFNPDIANYYCWAVGDKPYGNKGGSFHGKAYNRNTISIEICSTCVPATSEVIDHSNHDGWSFTPAVLDNAVKIAKIIMKKYNIPIDRVIRHYDISGKLCPGIIGWNDEPIVNKAGKKTGEMNNSQAWHEFKARLV